MLADLPELVRGDVVAERYELIRCLGMGGMGSVWEARHSFTQSRVALKVLRSELLANDDVRARFAQEARITAELSSEHLVRVLDAGIEPVHGLPYIAMELLEGPNLKQLLKQRGRIAPSEVLELMAQVAKLLELTHERAIVHRDLKPDNLVLHQPPNGPPQVKVLDFGIAKVVAETLDAETTAALGTPLYMAPEQIQGKADIGPSADLYALAHVAYALLVGEPYFQTEVQEQSLVEFCMFTAVLGAPEPATTRAARTGVSLPSALDPWFAKATALEPNERYQKAGEWLAELEAVFAPAKQAGAPPAPAEPGPPPSDEVKAPPVAPEPEVDLTPPVSEAGGVATVPSSAPPAPQRPARFALWLGLFALLGVGVLVAWLVLDRE